MTRVDGCNCPKTAMEHTSGCPVVRFDLPPVMPAGLRPSVEPAGLPTAAQQERFKHRANLRADRAQDILSGARTLLDKVIDAIEQADRIAEAADGPVLHVRDVLTDDDWRVIYQRLVEARALLPTQASDSPEKT